MALLALFVLAVIFWVVWYNLLPNSQKDEVKETVKKGNNAIITTGWVVADVAEQNSLEWKVKRLEAKLKQQGKGGE